jgi:hypothetical protein
VIEQMLNEARHCQARGMARCTVSGGPTQYPRLIVAQAADPRFARHRTLKDSGDQYRE